MNQYTSPNTTISPIRLRIGWLLMCLMTLGAIIGLSLHAPIPQALDYHAFSDQQQLFGVPNFYNVLSNLPFLIVGGLGLYRIWRQQLNIQYDDLSAYVVLFWVWYWLGLAQRTIITIQIIQRSYGIGYR